MRALQRFEGVTTVRQVMTRCPIVIHSGDYLGVAEALLQFGGLHHLPVVRGPRVIGLLTERALRRSLLQERPDRRMRVREVMKHPALTIAASAPVAAAGALMRRHRLDCLPVVERGALVGIVTRADLERPGSYETTEAPAAG